jgi:HAD superfamily hydrolase (TIGR01509 family)
VPLTAIFFDAGNTLVFPDLARTLAPLKRAGLSITQEQLHAAECAAKHKRDAAAARNAKLADQDYWNIFYSTLLATLGLSDAQLQTALVGEARRSGNWEYVLPGTHDALRALKERYKLGVISNSDGHIAELVERMGLADCFHAIIDSSIVGHEKPDARIFQAAMEAVGSAPADSLYVGDIYSIDYVGALGAGMQPLLFDVCGAYRETQLSRVESLQELAGRLLY